MSGVGCLRTCGRRSCVQFSRMTRSSRSFPPAPERHTFTWSHVAQITAAATAVGGLGLHLIGATADERYFRWWGLDTAMFPRAVDQTVILGYRALSDALSDAVVALVQRWLPVLLAYGFILAVSILLGLWWDRAPRFGRLRTAFASHAMKVRVAVAVLVSLALPTLILPFVLITAVLTLFLPMSAGEQYAQKSVRSMLADFKAGCGNADSRAKCASVRVQDREVARGFLIAANVAHIALYDPVSNRVLLLPREGSVFEGAPNSLASPTKSPPVVPQRAAGSIE